MAYKDVAQFTIGTMRGLRSFGPGAKRRCHASGSFYFFHIVIVVVVVFVVYVFAAVTQSGRPQCGVATGNGNRRTIDVRVHREVRCVSSCVPKRPHWAGGSIC